LEGLKRNTPKRERPLKGGEKLWCLVNDWGEKRWGNKKSKNKKEYVELSRTGKSKVVEQIGQKPGWSNVREQEKGADGN